MDSRVVANDQDPQLSRDLARLYSNGGPEVVAAWERVFETGFRQGWETAVATVAQEPGNNPEFMAVMDGLLGRVEFLTTQVEPTSPDGVATYSIRMRYAGGTILLEKKP